MLIAFDLFLLPLHVAIPFASIFAARSPLGCPFLQWSAGGRSVMHGSPAMLTCTTTFIHSSTLTVLGSDTEPEA